MEYEVRITVMQVITVPVEAESMTIAKMLAEKNWKNNEYHLPETHTRPKHERVTYEPLYPDIALVR